MLVQSTIRPRLHAIDDSLDIAECSISCDGVGGDYFDVIPLANSGGSQRVLVAIGDVSGHGVAAALVMSTARGILRSRATSCSSPAELLAHLNDLLAWDTPGGCFMTMQLGVVDLSTREMIWAGAGHDPVLSFDPETDRFQEIKAYGIPLGIDAGATYEEHRYPALKPGQILVLGTDGIWETRNPDGEMFGKKRLRACIRASSGASATEMVGAVRRELQGFRGPARRRDDMTLLIVKALPVDSEFCTEASLVDMPAGFGYP